MCDSRIAPDVCTTLSGDDDTSQLYDGVFANSVQLFEIENHLGYQCGKFVFVIPKVYTMPIV